MEGMPKFGDMKYVIKEHKAWSYHWDLRLQASRELAWSWALPKSPNLNPLEPQKAVWVGYRQVAYLCSERVISVGGPADGPTAIWDKGLYRVADRSTAFSQFNSGDLRVFLLGSRLRGWFTLKQIGLGNKKWQWAKEPDGYTDPFRQFPNVLTPAKIHELESNSLANMDPNQGQLLDGI